MVGLPPGTSRPRNRQNGRGSGFLSALRSIMASWKGEKTLATGPGSGYIPVPSSNGHDSFKAGTRGKHRRARPSYATMCGLAVLYVLRRVLFHFPFECRVLTVAGFFFWHWELDRTLNVNSAEETLPEVLMISLTTGASPARAPRSSRGIRPIFYATSFLCLVTPITTTGEKCLSSLPSTRDALALRQMSGC